MRKIIIMLLAGACISLSSCNDLLETDTNFFLPADDNKLNTVYDSLYSAIGILNQFQALSDRYIILGELRGDLLDVTPNASTDLQAINTFSATTENPYASRMEYYSVINNCNYYLQTVDTTVLAGHEKAMMREYVGIKTIRAWTYLQLCLNYGKVVYLEKPLLKVSEVNAEHEVIELDELVNRLIPDLLPWISTATPDYGTINSVQSSLLFIQPALLLGDLYLWKGDYANAAQYYHYYISANRIYPVIRNQWVDQFYQSSPSASWSNNFPYVNTKSNPFTISIIYNEADRSDLTYLMLPNFSESDASLYRYELAPSEVAKENWSKQPYTYSWIDNNVRNVTYLDGDLRGGPYPLSTGRNTLGASYQVSVTAAGDSSAFVSKLFNIAASGNTVIYSNSNNITSLYRWQGVYLRYVEALNRAGYPSLAFAELKYGLKPKVLSDSTIVNPAEVDPLPTFCSFFTSETYDAVNDYTGDYIYFGLHGIGCGKVEYDSVYYVLPELPTKADSILYVENLVCEEMALELAFEGTRFQDLMRFAIRRGDNAFLADKVAAKHGDNAPAIRALLMNREKWYLPSK